MNYRCEKKHLSNARAIRSYQKIPLKTSSVSNAMTDIISKQSTRETGIKNSSSVLAEGGNQIALPPVPATSINDFN